MRIRYFTLALLLNFGGLKSIYFAFFRLVDPDTLERKEKSKYTTSYLLLLLAGGLGISFGFCYLLLFPIPERPFDVVIHDLYNNRIQFIILFICTALDYIIFSKKIYRDLKKDYFKLPDNFETFEHVLLIRAFIYVFIALLIAALPYFIPENF